MRDYFKGKAKYFDTNKANVLPITLELSGIHKTLRKAQSTCYHTCHNRATQHPADLEDQLLTIVGRDVLDIVLQYKKWPFATTNQETARKAAEHITTMQQDTTNYNKVASRLRIALRSIPHTPGPTPRTSALGWSIEKLTPFELWTITHDDKFIGVYATKNAARRVLSGTTNPKTLEHLTKYEVPRAEPLDYLAQLYQRDHKLNYPLAAPIENVRINKENKIRLQTPLETGYTKPYGSRFLAKSARDAMLCAGDLTVFMEKPE